MKDNKSDSHPRRRSTNTPKTQGGLSTQRDINSRRLQTEFKFDLASKTEEKCWWWCNKCRPKGRWMTSHHTGKHNPNQEGSQITQTSQCGWRTGSTTQSLVSQSQAATTSTKKLPWTATLPIAQTLRRRSHNNFDS